MVENRLQKVREQYQLPSLSEIVQRIKSGRGKELEMAVIEAMTTNETLWFRDQHPFSNLTEKILPELTSRSSSVKIWSAACSTGQEPYSIAMTIQEYLRRNSEKKLSYRILATDISEHALDRCRNGVYDEYDLGRGLSTEQRMQYFEPQSGHKLRVKQTLRHSIKFEPLNLIHSFKQLGTFDLVFCRNVLIYFPILVKNDILQRIHNSLRPGGYLLLGSSENVGDLRDMFDMIPCDIGIVYQKR